MNKTNHELGSLSEEMSRVELGDKRLNRRVGQVTQALLAKPSDSFPKALGSEAFIESFYRLLRNPKVEYKQIIEPHIKASCERVKNLKEALVIHDTTKFKFKEDESREDIGWVHRQRRKKGRGEIQGFFGHFAIAVKTGVDNSPLGVIGFSPYRRLDPPSGRKKQADPRKESLRWGEMVQEVEERVSESTEVIHVIDSEGDIYELLSQMFESGNQFVIRANHDRVIKNDKANYLSEALVEQACICTREVKLRSRKKEADKNSKRNPKRESRTAQLGFSCGTVEIVRPERERKNSKTLQLNVVHVFEKNTPQDVQPVDWRLYTTEPIATEKDILRVVDFYRNRWLIEEYFKALKTGCSYEKRELESYHTLLNALALLIPVAWQLLLMRHLARDNGEKPASDYFTKSQIHILKLKASRKMSETPTLKEAIWAIASLGGHLKSNGDPGWLIIGRGFHDLLMMDMGYQFAKSERCDQ